MAPSRTRRKLGTLLKEARVDGGLTLRDVERRTGLGSGHLSQIETGTIAKPEMAILWDLAALYALDFEQLLALAGYPRAELSSGRQRHLTTVALRAMHELTPAISSM